MIDLSCGYLSVGTLTVFSFHVTYLFQGESTLASCLNVKELIAQNKE